MIVLAAIFFVLSVMQLSYSIPDSMVLLVVSATYLRGWQTKELGYGYAATAIAILFAAIEILSAVAGYVDGLILCSQERFRLTPAMLGLFTLPLLRFRWFP